jgi:hypothetical protein
VGECNEKNTGPRDGKSLHKYVSSGLLHAYGIPVDSGFYRWYAAQIAAGTPDSIAFRNPYVKPGIDSALLEDIREKTSQARVTENLFVKKGIFFGIYLSDDSYLRMLSMVPHMGGDAGRFYGMLQRLEDARKSGEMLAILDEMKGVSGMTPPLEKVYKRGLANLAGSILASGR